MEVLSNHHSYNQSCPNNHDLGTLQNSTAFELLSNHHGFETVPSNHQGFPQQQEAQGTIQHVVYQHEESALLPQRST
jgi:hypothetical protein